MAIPQWVLRGLVEKIKGGRLGWKFYMGKIGLPLMGGAWEEAHPHSQKQIFQPTLPIKLDALLFCS